jgi:hypothetical protein
LSQNRRFLHIFRAGGFMRAGFESSDSQPHCHFLIDNMHPRSVVGTLFVFFALTSLHLVAVLRAPHLLGVRDKLFEVNERELNNSVDVDITLAPIENRHRFLDLGCRVVLRTKQPQHSTFPVAVSTRAIFSRNFTVTNTIDSKPMEVSLAVPAGAKSSSLFPVLHKEVLDYDSVHIRMTVAMAFDGVRGLEFRWSFADPAAHRFQQTSLMLLSVFMLLMLIENFRRLTVEHELFAKLMCVGLALSGLFASNPTGFALPATPFVRLSDHTLMAVYIAAFRLTCLVQMETIRSGRPRPSLFLMLLFLVFFVIYAGVDAAANADRAKIYIEAETRCATAVAREGLGIAFHAAYIGAVGAWLVPLALTATPGSASPSSSSSRRRAPRQRASRRSGASRRGCSNSRSSPHSSSPSSTWAPARSWCSSWRRTPSLSTGASAPDGRTVRN